MSDFPPDFPPGFFYPTDVPDRQGRAAGYVLRCGCGQLYTSPDAYLKQCDACSRQASIDWLMCGGGTDGSCGAAPAGAAIPAGAVARRYAQVQADTDHELRELLRRRAHRHRVRGWTAFLQAVLALALACGVGMLGAAWGCW